MTTDFPKWEDYGDPRTEIYLNHCLMHRPGRLRRGPSSDSRIVHGFQSQSIEEVGRWLAEFGSQDHQFTAPRYDTEWMLMLPPDGGDDWWFEWDYDPTNGYKISTRTVDK